MLIMSLSIMSIVILGGNFAALKASVLIFNEISKSSNASKYEVTIVSPSEKWWYNPASPRMLVDAEMLKKAEFDLRLTLEKRANGAKFKIIKGKAVNSDFKAQLVKVELSTGGEEVIEYDYLVVATGAGAASPAFKLNGNYEESVAAIEKITKSVENSENVAILGGGVTGVEVSGELADKYPGKNFTLYTGSLGPLSNLGGPIGDKATTQLKALGVQIVNNKRFTDIKDINNGFEITFDDGSSVVADTYIPTYGLHANTDFISSEYLDDQKFLKSGKDLIVTGTNNVFAFGDVVSGSRKTLVDIKLGQQKAFDTTIHSIIFNQGTEKGSFTGSPNVIFVPISGNGGVGYIFGWSLPSFVIWFFKARDYMIGKAAAEA